MKSIIVTSLLAMFTNVALAGNAYDGLYFCSLTAAGYSGSSYIAVNTSGRTGVITIPYFGGEQDLDGYTIGQWEGSVLSGHTNYSGAVRATFTPTTANIDLQLAGNGRYIPATGVCSRVI